MTEIWKSIEGYSKYEVSILGQVRNSATKKILKLQTESNGYSCCSLKDDKTGKFKTKTVHRLVLTAFDRPPKNGEECCHYDGNRKNNNFKNLRWGTKADNQKDRLRHGTHLRGMNGNGAKLDQEYVNNLRKRIRNNEKVNYSAEGRKLNCSHETIRAAANYISYKEVSQ